MLCQVSEVQPSQDGSSKINILLFFFESLQNSMGTYTIYIQISL